MNTKFTFNNIRHNILYYDISIRGGPTLGKESIPPNSDLAPKCDMKHCLTNSKNQHVYKKGCLWPLKHAKVRFRSRLPLGANNAFQTLSRLGGDNGTPLLIPHPTWRLWLLDLVGPQYFCL